MEAQDYDFPTIQHFEAKRKAMQPTKVIQINPRCCYIGIAYQSHADSKNPNYPIIEGLFFSSNSSCTKFFQEVSSEKQKNLALLFPSDWQQCLSEQEFDSIFDLITSKDMSKAKLAGQLLMMFKSEYESLTGQQIKPKNSK